MCACFLYVENKRWEVMKGKKNQCCGEGCTLCESVRVIPVCDL